VNGSDIKQIGIGRWQLRRASDVDKDTVTDTDFARNPSTGPNSA
jgi:hypothetical protein